jgi:hypothetical protein
MKINKMKPIVSTKKNTANGLQVVVPNHIEGESRVVNAPDEKKSSRRRRRHRCSGNHIGGRAKQVGLYKKYDRDETKESKSTLDLTIGRDMLTNPIYVYATLLNICLHLVYLGDSNAFWVACIFDIAVHSVRRNVWYVRSET